MAPKGHQVEPVSTTEFQQAIGEIRRRGDERHQENLARMQALELEFRAHAKEDLLAMARIDKSIAHNTDLTRAALNAANENKKLSKESSDEIKASVQGFIDAAQTAKTLKKFVIGSAAIVGAIATIVAVVLWAAGAMPGGAPTLFH